MGKSSYLGGSTILGPGPSFFRETSDQGNARRIIDPSLRTTMLEHDRLRSLGIDPVEQAKKEAKAHKAKRKKLKAEIKSLRAELDTLRATKNAD